MTETPAKPKQPSRSGKADREQRLAEALRENLRKRKEQMRRRQSSGDAPANDPDARQDLP